MRPTRGEGGVDAKKNCKKNHFLGGRAYLVPGGVLSPGELYLVLGVYLVPGGVSARGDSVCQGLPAGRDVCPGGCVCQGGVSDWGVCLPGGVPAKGACLPRGVYLPGWSCLPGGYLPRYSPLWTEFLTHASENITLPQTSFAGGKKLGG